MVVAATAVLSVTIPTIVVLVSEAARVTAVITESLTTPSIKQEGGARRILITTEPKIFVSRIDVEGLRRPNHERIT